MPAPPRRLLLFLPRLHNSLLPLCPWQWFYFAGFILSLVACWLLRDHGDQWLDFSPLNQARRLLGCMPALLQGPCMAVCRAWPCVVHGRVAWPCAVHALVWQEAAHHISTAYPLALFLQCLSDTSPPDRACMGQQAVIAVSFGGCCEAAGAAAVGHHSNGAQPVCAGAAAPAAAAGTFCFFSLHFLLLLGVTHRANWRLPLHTGFWPIK